MKPKATLGGVPQRGGRSLPRRVQSSPQLTALGNKDIRPFSRQFHVAMALMKLMVVDQRFDALSSAMDTIDFIESMYTAVNSVDHVKLLEMAMLLSIDSLITSLHVFGRSDATIMLVVAYLLKRAIRSKGLENPGIMISGRCKSFNGSLRPFGRQHSSDAR